MANTEESSICMVSAYKELSRKLIAERARGLLSIDDQAEICERLDDLWRNLEYEQQQEIEDWLNSKLIEEGSNSKL